MAGSFCDELFPACEGQQVTTTVGFPALGCCEFAAGMIPLQLPLAPTGLFAIRVELPNDVAVQGIHDPYFRHQGIAAAAAQHQHLDSHLPFGHCRFLSSAVRDVGRGVLECDQLSAVRPFDGVIEAGGSAQCRQPSLSTSVLKLPGIRGASPSLVALQTGHGAPGAPQWARVRAFPGLVRMALADPSAIFAEGAFHLKQLKPGTQDNT
jgi:hypothetical protein